MSAKKRLVLVVISAGVCAHLAAAQSQAPTEKDNHSCSIRGQVVNKLTGTPVKHVALRLKPMVQDAQSFSTATLASLGLGSQAATVYATSSGGDGSFCLENVKDGRYTLSGTKNGFLETNYGADSPTESGKTVAAGGQEVTLGMLPQAVVSGRVTDEDEEPLGGAFVNVLTRVLVGGQLHVVRVRSAQSNDLGEFRIANVPPGVYCVLVEPKPEGGAAASSSRRLLRTFAPSVTRLSEATPFLLQAGEERSGINVKMLSGSTYHVRGAVSGLGPSDRGGVTLSADGEESLFIGAGAGNLKPDGSFDFAGVAPGSYTLKYVQISGDSAKGGARSVEVSDKDLGDVSLAATQPAIIHGRIHVDNASTNQMQQANLKSVRLTLIASDAIVGPRLAGSVSEDGSFVVRNIITPGRYVVRIDPIQDAYVKSVRYGQTDATGRDIDFSDGAAGEMEITLRYGLAKVTGRIERPQTEQGSFQEMPILHVVLIPKVQDSLESGIMFANSDASGSVSISQVPPGGYRAYAMESVDFVALHDRAVLRALEGVGVEVDLAEGDDKAISLRMIPAEQLHGIASNARSQ
jgi:hypothetical protein